MLRKQDMSRRGQVMLSSLENLVPKDHLVRKIDAVLDFEFIYDLVDGLYSEDQGRPSLDPVVLIKITFIQYLFGIRSMRQTIKEIETNVAYRWFLGLGLEDVVPHFSTFGKNYSRRFEGTKVFEQIFNHILRQALELGFVKPEEVFIDGTHVKAYANKNKRTKIIVKEEGRIYTGRLEAEINELRKEKGKNPLKKNEKIKERKIVKSTTDPDAGLFYKNEREKSFCYSFNTACDKYGFVLGTHVSAGNVHDSKNFIPIFNQVRERFPEMRTVAVDAGYVTPHIAMTCFENDVRPVMPYKRPMTKKGFFKKYEFVYDEHYNQYICPAGETLKFTTITREGYKEYKSNSKVCKDCKELSNCTESKNHQKLIQRHIWAEFLEEANHLRHTSYNKEVYPIRSQSIERVFGDFKVKHGMRNTNYRGISKVKDEAMLVFACMNLKKMANWNWN